MFCYIMPRIELIMNSVKYIELDFMNAIRVSGMCLVFVGFFKMTQLTGTLVGMPSVAAL